MFECIPYICVLRGKSEVVRSYPSGVRLEWHGIRHDRSIIPILKGCWCHYGHDIYYYMLLSTLASKTIKKSLTFII